MQFTSLAFLLFFSAVLCGFLVLPVRWRRPFLLAASLGFYLYGAPRYGVFLVCAIVATYLAALAMGRAATPGRKRLALAGGMALTLGLLLFFKYYNFTVENVGAVLAVLGRENPLPLMGIALPVGISFYTFQSLGYLLDVYRGQTEPERNFITYALFIAFFPQVQSGPISRSTTLLPQLRAAPARPAATEVYHGLCMALWGAFKKLVIADRLAIPVAAVFDSWQARPGALLALGIVLYAFQLYCDFSGYSTIAIGCARALGYRLDPNFNFPFFSASIPEFWRRWHISLSTWFRDYLFYPLLRSRPLMALARWGRGRLPTYYAQNLPVVCALAVVWLTTGLWHGASWGYVAYGAWHGLLIILSTLLAPAMQKLRGRLHISAHSRPWHTFSVLRTFLLVCVGLVFFRAGTLGAGLGILGRLFTAPFSATSLWNGTLLTLGLTAPEWGAAAAGLLLLFVAENLLRKRDLYAALQARPLALRWAIYLGGLLLILVFGVYGAGYVDKPFIYFQF